MKIVRTLWDFLQQRYTLFAHYLQYAYLRVTSSYLQAFSFTSFVEGFWKVWMGWRAHFGCCWVLSPQAFASTWLPSGPYLAWWTEALPDRRTDALGCKKGGPLSSKASTTESEKNQFSLFWFVIFSAEFLDWTDRFDNFTSSRAAR